jgi:hypothetical protein
MKNPIALFVNYSGWYCVDMHHYSGIHTGKQGSHGSWKNPRIRKFYKADPAARDMIYSEFYTGSVCLFSYPVFGFMRNDVHASGKHCFTGLFLQNNPFNRISTLLFSGLYLVTFFATCFMPWDGVKGNRKPVLARQCDHVGEWRWFSGLSGFYHDPGFLWMRLRPDFRTKIFSIIVINPAYGYCQTRTATCHGSIFYSCSASRLLPASVLLPIATYRYNYPGSNHHLYPGGSERQAEWPETESKGII